MSDRARRFRKMLGVVVLSATAITLGGVIFVRHAPDRPIQDRAFTPWPAGTTPTKIVAFGTSLTLGNGWPDRLSANLEGCFGHRVDVVRVARAGAGSAWGIDAVETVVAQAPDVVLMEFAINDADLRDGVSLAQSDAQHRAIIAQLQHNLPEVRIAVMTMSPAFGPRGWMRPRLPRYYDQLTDLTKDTNHALVDFYPRWLAAGLRNAFEDGLHPDGDATAAIMDQHLADHIAQAAGIRCTLDGRQPD